MDERVYISTPDHVSLEFELADAELISRLEQDFVFDLRTVDVNAVATFQIADDDAQRLGRRCYVATLRLKQSLRPTRT